MPTPKSLATSKKILKTAAKLFDKYGFYNVSIKEIASGAKINSALISYHFGSKKNLYLAVLEKQVETLLKLEETIRELEAPPLEKLNAFLTGIMQLQLDNKQHIKLFYQEMITPTGLCGDYLSERLDSIHQYTQNLVEEAIKEGSLDAKITITHTAFGLEALMVLAFLSRKELQRLCPGKEQDEKAILLELINSYLAPIMTLKEDI